MAAADSTSVFAALEALGLRHERRRSAHGVAYAGLRQVAADGAETAFTLIVDEAVLRITVHRIAPAGTAPGGMQALRRGADLPLGAAYRSPDDGTLELSIGVWLGDAAQLEAAWLGAMLDHAAAAARALTGAPVPPRPALPAAAAAAAKAEAAVREVFEALGHAVERDGAATRLRLALAPDRSAELLLSAAADGWIDVAARTLPPLPLPGDAATESVVQRLQRWTRAGRFVPAADAAELRAVVSTPARGDAAEAWRWSASQAAAMLSTAARHLAR